MKYSKSNQDPHQTDRDREALTEMAKTKCRHFDVDSFIVWRDRWGSQRAQIVVRSGPGLIVKHDDGTFEVLFPFALRNEAPL